MFVFATQGRFSYAGMMKPSRLALFAAAALALSPALSARADSKDELAPTVAAPDAATQIPISQEFEIDGAYASPSETKQGNARLGGISNTYGHADYVVSPQIQDGLLLRFGVDAERNSFGLPDRSIALPNTLQSVNAIIGADIAVNDKILIRAEVHPGIYSDFVNVTGSDFDAPVQVGGTYLWSKDLQLILGVQIDLKSDIPIIGLPGFRWQFADKWVLSAIPPKPQLQYELSKSVTLYTGAEILGGTYHLNNDFGTNHDHDAGFSPEATRLNGNIADFGEFRVGAGVTWNFLPNVSLDVSGGYVPYRQFDLHSDHIEFDERALEFHNNIGAGGAYGEMGIKGSF